MKHIREAERILKTKTMHKRFNRRIIKADT